MKIFLINQCEIRIEGKVRVGTGCGRALKLSNLVSKWQAVGSAQCVALESHSSGSAVMSCISLRNPRLSPNLLYPGTVPAQSGLRPQHRQAHNGVLQAKVRHPGTPPLYCGLGVSGTTALQNSWYIWPSLVVPHLGLMMVISNSHNSNPLKVIKWLPVYHSHDKAGT